MNPLIHAQLNLSLLKRLKLGIDQDLFVLGGILPDIYLAGWASQERFHRYSKQFLTYLAENDPAYTALGAGFLAHGEEPEGLDFFAHRKGGFVEKKLMLVKPFVVEERPKIRDDELTDISHSLIEFACDYFSDYEAANALNFAFERVDLKRVAFHLSTFFGTPRKKTYKLLKTFRNFNFQGLRTIKGVSSNVKRFLVWKDLTSSTMLEKYRFLKIQLHFMRRNVIVRVFNKVRAAVKPDFESFLRDAEKGTGKSLLKHLPPGLA